MRFVIIPNNSFFAFRLSAHASHKYRSGSGSRDRPHPLVPAGSSRRIPTVDESMLPVFTTLRGYKTPELGGSGFCQAPECFPVAVCGACRSGVVYPMRLGALRGYKTPELDVSGFYTALRCSPVPQSLTFRGFIPPSKRPGGSLPIGFLNQLMFQ
jgi:hypothetical protein